jgi:hypothetical protein
MTFTLEAMQANDGDCLFLHYQKGAGTPVRVLIDGGAKTIFKNVLAKRIDQLRGKKPLDLRMVMVSHIDADHITGILDFFKALEQQFDDNETLFCDIGTLWHNAFEQLNKGTNALAHSAAMKASVDGVDIPPGLETFTQAVVASVPQGHELRRLATKLKVPINEGSGGDVVVAPAKGKKVVKIADGLTFTILAPNVTQLDRLEQEFLKAKAKKKGATDAAIAADYLNNTVPNMSSVVVIAEAARPGGKKPLTMLLAGDARGDVILESLESAGVLKPKGTCHFDLLKVQHHCSSHSTTQDFFERVTADHYVISGNGKHDIPHPKALGWLSAARSGQAYDAYLTNRIGVDSNKKTMDTFLASEKKLEKNHSYHFRAEKDLSISVELG